ncbi:alpha-acetolactate decarboxylase [soil metagenome]
MWSCAGDARMPDRPAVPRRPTPSSRPEVPDRLVVPDPPAPQSAAGSLRPTAGSNVEQFSVVHALMAGLYDGVTTIAEVLQAGDFGVGCGHALNGELVFIDGQVYRCTSDGSVSRVEVAPRESVGVLDDSAQPFPQHSAAAQPSGALATARPDSAQLVPFAEVVKFTPTFSLAPDSPHDRTSLEELILSILPSMNSFYAIRVDGRFESVLVREPVRQHHPFRPLREVMAAQNENEIANTTGSLIGFWAPQIFQGISVAGFHLHYLDDERAVGGHSLNYRMLGGTLSIQALSGITVHLPDTPAYNTAELAEPNSDADIRRVESQTTGGPAS